MVALHAHEVMPGDIYHGELVSEVHEVGGGVVHLVTAHHDHWLGRHEIVSVAVRSIPPTD